MTPIVPNRFLVRLCHPCEYCKAMPLGDDDDGIVDLPESARIETFAELDNASRIGDVRLAWNEFGIGVQVTVAGKEQEPQGDIDRPKTSDGFTLWIDTRDARSSHRATRYCHQFHFLPSGGGTEKEEPAFAQAKINRALQDAPLCTVSDVPFRSHTVRGGYRLEAFLPVGALTGYDPEQHPRLGFYFALRDRERGDEFLSVNADFPFADDPSLWAVLELTR